MDKKIEIKEDLLLDDIAPKNEGESFHEIVIMKNSDDVLLDDDCDITIKTEIKSKTSFTNDVIRQINSDTVTCSKNWKTDRTIGIDHQTPVSDFGLQGEEEFLPEEHVMENKKINSDHEMNNKIEIKDEPGRLEAETSSVSDDIKDVDIPPVKCSRLCTENVSGSSGKSLLLSVENSERDTNLYSGQDHLEIQKMDATEMPTVKECALSEQFDVCSDEKIYLKPAYLKLKSLNHKGQKLHKCNNCAKSFACLANLEMHNVIHKGKKTYQCESCSKSFAVLSRLERHNLIQEGKTCQCKTCHKSFTHLSNTNNLIHEGRKPYQCKTCHKSFTHL